MQQTHVIICQSLNTLQYHVLMFEQNGANLNHYSDSPTLLRLVLPRATRTGEEQACERLRLTRRRAGVAVPSRGSFLADVIAGAALLSGKFLETLSLLHLLKMSTASFQI